MQIPPIKCQGIKSKLVPFILSSIHWDGTGKWVEPFLGSGVVLFNLAPRKAYVADTNEHIIRLYQDIAAGSITPETVRENLIRGGKNLSEQGEDYYYEVRERFNRHPNSLDFLFLNRSCFNGVMRFNSKGEYNVPFCHKPERFKPAYITKIVNQVTWVYQVMKNRDWTFIVADWRQTLNCVDKNDFVYADPPYYGRHTDYYSCWSEKDALQLFESLINLPCGFALSTWKENKYRANPHVKNLPSSVVMRTFQHFYHVGSKESLRNAMEEALVIHSDFAANPLPKSD